MTFHDGNTYICNDPYSYEGLITEEEEKMFSKGIWTEVYHKMGCHKVKLRDTEGMYFAVWVPVSYTHLDVYKRQAFGRKCFN